MNQWAIPVNYETKRKLSQNNRIVNQWFEEKGFKFQDSQWSLLNPWSVQPNSKQLGKWMNVNERENKLAKLEEACRRPFGSLSPIQVSFPSWAAFFAATISLYFFCASFAGISREANSRMFNHSTPVYCWPLAESCQTISKLYLFGAGGGGFEKWYETFSCVTRKDLPFPFVRLFFWWRMVNSVDRHSNTNSRLRIFKNVCLFLKAPLLHFWLNLLGWVSFLLLLLVQFRFQCRFLIIEHQRWGWRWLNWCWAGWMDAWMLSTLTWKSGTLSVPPPASAATEDFRPFPFVHF